MITEIENLIHQLINNDCRLDGEDGGTALTVLAEHLQPLGVINAGRVDYGTGGVCELRVLVYNYRDWKFVVQQDDEVSPVYDGGTVYTGTVDVYTTNGSAVGDTEDTSGIFEPAVYYDEHGM